MPEIPDPDAVAINMLRAVSESGFGIIKAIQAQAQALNELISMVQTDPSLNRPSAAATLDHLHQARAELDSVYDMALDATVSTWSITELPDALSLPPGSAPPAAETPPRPETPAGPEMPPGAVTPQGDQPAAEDHQE